MTHEMHLQSEPFAKMAAGEKTIELRLYDPKRRQIHVGDTIVFDLLGSEAQKLQRRVVALHVFADFAALYAALPLERCGYRPEDVAAASPRDMEQYYTPEAQATWGVVGIELGQIG